MLIAKMPLTTGHCKYLSPQFVVLNEQTYIFFIVDNILINKWQHNVKCLKEHFNSYDKLSYKMSVSHVLVFWWNAIASQIARTTLYFSHYFWHHNIIVRIKNPSSHSVFFTIDLWKTEEDNWFMLLHGEHLRKVWSQSI